MCKVTVRWRHLLEFLIALDLMREYIRARSLLIDRLKRFGNDLHEDVPLHKSRRLWQCHSSRLHLGSHRRCRIEDTLRLSSEHPERAIQFERNRGSALHRRRCRGSGYRTYWLDNLVALQADKGCWKAHLLHSSYSQHKSSWRVHISKWTDLIR